MEKPVDGPHERDQSLERLLRQSLRTPRHAGVTDSCLDAETLAAWTDRSLSGAALEAVQLHVADCPRCQDLVGTLARVSSTVPEPAPVPSSRRWLAWLVPLIAAAAAVALWVALPNRNALVSQAPLIQDKGAEVKARESGRSLEDDHSPAPQVTQRPQTPAPATPSRQDSTIAVGAVTKEVGSDNTKDEIAGNSAGAGRLEEAEILKKAAPSPSAAPASAAAAAPSPLSERVVGLARSAARVADLAPTEIVSPDASVRWRFAGSVVQHSANGGSTWEAVSTGVTSELAAGAAPSTTVCWLVGRGGVVLLTTDGRTWRRVTFPEMTDLSAVRATDAGARVVSVSTVDGRTFVTTDGGITWVSR
jgi:hypothetical protein